MKKTEKNLRMRVLVVEHYGTQEKFSAATGISEAAVSKIIRGFYKPSDNQKKIIAKALKTNDLFKEV